MKKSFLLLSFCLLLLTVGCKKNMDTFPFKGKVVGYVNCTMSTATISEIDFGYVVALTIPDSVGNAYTNENGTKYNHCVVIYRTRQRCHEGDEISGTMYLDDDYSRAYCNYHFNLGLPEGVCYTLD